MSDGNVLELTTASQLHEILSAESGIISFIDCYAHWCGPCKAAYPTFKEFANRHVEFENIKFYKLNIETPDPEIQQFVEENAVTYIPLFLIVENGQVIHRENNIKQLVNSFKIQEKQPN